MSDTHIENSICQAIDIIASGKVAQAGFDRTIKGVIDSVSQKTLGRYNVKYQDSLFQAYATSSKITYEKDQLVTVLIPGNDWDRRKIILNAQEIAATNYQSVPIISENTNSIGPNGISDFEAVSFSSYRGTSQPIVITEGFKDISSYIKKGNSINLGIKVRTALAASQQAYGTYGARFYLKFKDSTGNPVTKIFKVSQLDTEGNPYSIIDEKWIQTSYRDIKTEDFIEIEKVELFCESFPQDPSKIDIEDIFITDVSINGSTFLTDAEKQGLLLHINDKDGNIINEKTSDEDNPQIELTAQLKVNGVITTQKVTYFWFRQNGLIFSGNDKYISYAGNGWECLNYYQNSVAVPRTQNTFIFQAGVDNAADGRANAPNKVTKVLCVALYDNKTPVKKQIDVINKNIADIRIISSDQQIDNNGNTQNTTQYYLGHGSPTLICQIQTEKQDGTIDYGVNSEYSYTWSFIYANGGTNTIDTGTFNDSNKWETAIKNYNEQINKISKMAQVSANNYKDTTTYMDAIEDYNNRKIEQGGNGYKYYNYNMNQVDNYVKIICSVKDENNIYKGCASITLYNKIALQGSYSLNIKNGTQIFQYDEKGNSPYTKEVDRKPTETEDKPPVLSFVLLNAQSQQIPYQEIINNGYVCWCFPGHDTLLISNQENMALQYDKRAANNTDLALAAGLYNLYKNRPTFNYSIEDKYTLSKINNTIKLVVKYNDLTFEAYTDFTFPKNGDPGTNGTDLVTKLVPYNENNEEVNSDRIYAQKYNNGNLFYTDSGQIVDKLKLFIYNNNSPISYSNSVLWTCPPKTTNEDKNKTDKNVITVDVNGILKLSNVVPTSINNDDLKEFIHIVRGKTTLEKTTNNDKGSYNVDYMAQFPICYVHVIDSKKYRIKIKPKTGFKYVVYQQDGTRPDYDNQPFEIIVEKYIDSYWTTEEVGSLEKSIWTPVGGISLSSTEGSIVTATPSQTFDGQDLNTAIIVNVIEGENNNIGFIHIPIYKLINRYGHNALNGWDGNSIQLNANGDTILAPQIGAGKKSTSDNTFTGVLMGDIKTASSEETGIMGFYKGQRSIFLDSNTGSAIFGKQGSGQIKIDPSLVVRPDTNPETSWNNAKQAGLLYSSNYTLPSTTIISTGTNKDKKGITLSVDTYKPSSSSGMIIDLSTPQIGFGSGDFYVTSDGHIHAGGGGDIAGWIIRNTKLFKDILPRKKEDNTIQKGSSTGMASEGNPVFWAYETSLDKDGKTVVENKNFYVNRNGFLFSKSGQIAGWNIESQRLYNSKVGMNSDPNNSTYKLSTWPDGKSHNAKAFFANDDNFYVTHDGYLRSTSGKIANWDINKARLSNGNVGMGQVVFEKANNNSQNPFGEAITARFWGAGSTLTMTDDNTGVGTVKDNTTSGILNLNFAISNDGKLYSKAGQIGGWHIEKNYLWAVNSTDDSAGIRLSADGKMSGGAGYNATTQSGGTWAIYKDGSSSFTNITTNHLNASNVDATNIVTHDLTANDGGTIGGFTIGASTLKGGDLTLNSAGSMSGPSWSISSDGIAHFGSIYGTIAEGKSLQAGGVSMNGTGTSNPGITGNGGNWKMPGGGAPSWTYGGKTLTPQQVKVIEKLALQLITATSGNNLSVGTGSWYAIPLPTITRGEDTEYTIPPNHTDTITIKVPNYTISSSNSEYLAPKAWMNLGTNKVVTGWTSDTKLQSIQVMASTPSAQSVGDE